MQTADLIDALAHFTGSEEHYQHFTRALVYTDGVQFLAGGAGAHWLIDAAASHQSPALDRKAEGFQLWTLTRNGPDHQHPGGASLTCRADTDGPVLIRQEIEYTDFPLPVFSFYFEGTAPHRVMLLRSEH